jgi:hypothetical protein
MVSTFSMAAHSFALRKRCVRLADAVNAVALMIGHTGTAFDAASDLFAADLAEATAPVVDVPVVEAEAEHQRGHPAGRPGAPCGAS